MGEVAKKRALRSGSLVTSRSLPSLPYTPHILVFCAVVKPTCPARSLPEPSKEPGRDRDAQPRQREPGGSELAGPPVPGTWKRIAPLPRGQRPKRSFSSQPSSGSKAPGAAYTSARRPRSSRSGAPRSGKAAAGRRGRRGAAAAAAPPPRPAQPAQPGPQRGASTRG